MYLVRLVRTHIYDFLLIHMAFGQNLMSYRSHIYDFGRYIGGRQAIYYTSMGFANTLITTITPPHSPGLLIRTSLVCYTDFGLMIGVPKAWRSWWLERVLHPASTPLWYLRRPQHWGDKTMPFTRGLMKLMKHANPHWLTSTPSCISRKAAPELTALQQQIPSKAYTLLRCIITSMHQNFRCLGKSDRELVYH